MKTITAVLLVAGVVTAKTPPPQEGTYYTYAQLGVKKTEQNGSKLELTFQPVPERAYWCPGAKIKETKKAVIVTFVRCETFKTCPVDIEAAIGKQLIRTISIDTRGKDTYVTEGPKQLKKIYSSKDKKKEPRKPEKKPAEAKDPQAVKKATPIEFPSTDDNGWIKNKLATPQSSAD